MKHIALVLALSLPAASCETLGEVLKVPGAVVSDVGGAVEAVVPGESDPKADAIGEAAGDVAGILTGNPLVDLLVTTLVGGAVGFFLRKKKAA